MGKNKSELKKDILEKIKHVDMPYFLYLEIEQILSFLNNYKLYNLYNNIDNFIEYINNLNSDYADELNNLICNQPKQINETKNN